MLNTSPLGAGNALRKAFRDLPKLARELEAPRPKSVVRDALDASEPLVWSLALDEIRDTGIELRPRLPFNGPLDFTGPVRTSLRAASAPLSNILKPITLDPLTVADDPNFLIEIANQPNVTESVRNGLSGLY
jgi:5-methylthioadenosine/S-adenosylhomocysteine deaminase